MCRAHGAPLHVDAAQIGGQACRSTSRRWASTCCHSRRTSCTARRASARFTCSAAVGRPSCRSCSAAARSAACAPARCRCTRSSAFGLACELAASAIAADPTRRRSCATSSGPARALPGALLNGHPRERCPASSMSRSPAVEGESLLFALAGAGARQRLGLQFGQRRALLRAACARSRPRARAELRCASAWGASSRRRGRRPRNGRVAREVLRLRARAQGAAELGAAYVAARPATRESGTWVRLMVNQDGEQLPAAATRRTAARRRWPRANGWRPSLPGRSWREPGLAGPWIGCASEACADRLTMLCDRRRAARRGCRRPRAPGSAYERGTIGAKENRPK